MNVPQWQSNPQQNPSQPRGRDPRTPFGSPDPASFNAPTQIEAYQQPRSGVARSVLFAGIALAVVAAVLLGLQFLGSGQDQANGGSSSVGPAVGASSLGAGASSAPFEVNGGGTFELLSQNWTSDKDLEVQIRITLNEGSASFDAYLLSSKTMKSYQSTNSPSMRVSAGQPAEITLNFVAPRENGTIVLSNENGNGRAIAALQINS